MRRRARQFNPNVEDFKGAIHWLWKRRVPRKVIADIFGKTVNLISVEAHNEADAESERQQQIVLPPKPDFALAEDEFFLGEPPKSTAELAEEVEQAGTEFWSSVRTLEGLRVYGNLLQKLSRRSEEDVLAWRLRARLRKMTAETYVHAGYVWSAIFHAEEAIDLYFRLYKETRSKLDLFNYAKTALLISLARIQREEWASALGTLMRAEAAFAAADVPMDPELYRQRASILFRQGRDEDAAELFKKAYDAFPAHRMFLGFGQGEHARHDVGRRPLAYLKGDFDLALENLEIARAWPAGDIHRAINLNAAIATAFLTGSGEAMRFIDDNMARAIEASAGFGRQSTTIRLLELTPRIPKEPRGAWIRFVLEYNAYRNR